MDTCEQLYAKALRNRNHAIRQAKKEYLWRLDEIDRLLRDHIPRRRDVVPHSAVPKGDSLCGITTSKAAQLVLREFGPLTTVEIALLIQKLVHFFKKHSHRAHRGLRETTEVNNLLSVFSVATQ